MIVYILSLSIYIYIYICLRLTHCRHAPGLIEVDISTCLNQEGTAVTVWTACSVCVTRLCEWRKEGSALYTVQQTAQSVTNNRLWLVFCLRVLTSTRSSLQRRIQTHTYLPTVYIVTVNFLSNFWNCAILLCIPCIFIYFFKIASQSPFIFRHKMPCIS
jgi:hypothetical protein